MKNGFGRGSDNKGERIKKRIVETLKTHPEGLTIQDLSNALGAHRQTITKYVLVLEAKDVIYRRRIGSATLHYHAELLKKMRKRFERK